MNKFPIPQLVKMVIPFSFRNSKLLNKLPVRYGVPALEVGQGNQYFGRKFIEFITLWTRIVKLFFKVFVYQVKIAILTQKRRVLLFQRRNLLREQRNLLLKEVNHVFGQPGGLGDTNKIFNGFGGINHK